MTAKLTVTVITKNEEINIAHCLESILWADEIVVVDSGSTDETIAICRNYPCRVVQTAWKGFGLTKRYAVGQASHDWILSLDADETVTGELATAITTLLAREPTCHAYRIRRRSFYLGSEIRFSGWRYDRPIRLFDRRFGTFNDRALHESVVVTGNVGELRDAMLHYPYPTVSSHLAKMDRYGTLGAQLLFDRGKSSTIPEAVARGVLKFIKMFVLHGGFLDGRSGFLLALNSSVGIYLKYVKLWDLSRRQRST